MNALSLSIALLSLWGLSLTTPKRTPVTVPTPAKKPIAVVELFTSEGCSSCPSADKLLTETVQKANGQAIYALSFHVDYWNRLGWRDPFSDAKFSTRQREYAQRFKTSSIYTPQVVLNGQYEFVGSNKARLTTLLAEVLKQPSSVEIDLSTAGTGNDLTVNYSLTGDLAGTVVNIAVVSQHESREVSRGENAGRKLTHNNVVRVFETRPANAKGTLKLTLPDGFDRTDGAIIAYIQNSQNRTVLGANRVVLR